LSNLKKIIISSNLAWCFTNKGQRNPKGQLRINNPETLAILGTRHKHKNKTHRKVKVEQNKPHQKQTKQKTQIQGIFMIKYKIVQPKENDFQQWFKCDVLQ
jgi:hypothetical protein